jgi:DNA-binding MarR family transcriptional regulator
MSQAQLFLDKHQGSFEGRDAIRLWLRMLSATAVIEKRLQRGLAEQFSSSLTRFDLLAALDRHPEGMTMGDLSKALLVSNGNVTGRVQKLRQDGHVTVTPLESDQRVSVVRLTERGADHFAEMTAAHHGWVEDMLAGLGAAERKALFDLLGEVKQSIADSVAKEEDI